MANYFNNKWLLRYYPVKPYNELSVVNLGIMDISNPESAFHKKDAIFMYNCYEDVKRANGYTDDIDGAIVVNKIDSTEWLLVEAATIEGVLLKFEDQRKSREAVKRLSQ